MIAEDREKMSVIPYAVSMAGRFQSNPGVDHWTAVKNILKYLKRTKEMFLIYGGDQELIVKGYVDMQALTLIWMTLSLKPDMYIFLMGER